MGIENRGGFTCDVERVRVCSLPLMGIENFAERHDAVIRLRVPRPHYPSWGSKTPVELVNRFTVTGGSSLPLMGIENTDRRAAICSMISARPAHYPSWGSKTLAAMPAAVGASATDPSHYPSWGSKTR